MSKEQVIEEVDEEVEKEDEAKPDLIESRAKLMGHSSKEEWRGSPDDWVDAKTFLDRADSAMPILRERNKKLEREFNELKERQNKLIKSMFDKEGRELKAQQKAAVKDGDTEAFEAAEKALADIDKQRDEAQPQKDDPVLTQWKEDNPWYSSDFEKHDYANRYAEFLAGTGLSGKELLDKVAAEVKTKFGKNARREKPSDADGGTPPQKRGGKTYEDLPADAKAVCDKHVKRGEMTKAEYVANYEFD